MLALHLGVSRLPPGVFSGGFLVKEEQQSRAAFYLPAECGFRAAPLCSPCFFGLGHCLYVPHPLRARAVEG